LLLLLLELLLAREANVRAEAADVKKRPPREFRRPTPNIVVVWDQQQAANYYEQGSKHRKVFVAISWADNELP
jgi:hypothetical protein